MNKYDRKNFPVEGLSDNGECNRTERANSSNCDDSKDGDVLTPSAGRNGSSSFIAERSLQFRSLRNDWEWKSCASIDKPFFRPAPPVKDNEGSVADTEQVDDRDDEILGLQHVEHRAPCISSQEGQSPQNQQLFYSTYCRDEARDCTNTASNTSFNSAFLSSSGTTLPSLDPEHDNTTESSSSRMEGTFQSLTPLQQPPAGTATGTKEEVRAGKEVGGGQRLQVTVATLMADCGQQESWRGTMLTDDLIAQKMDRVGVELTQQKQPKQQRRRRRYRRRTSSNSSSGNKATDNNNNTHKSVESKMKQRKTFCFVRNMNFGR